jgi:hypothetical protein
MVAVRDPDEIERSLGDADNKPPAPALHRIGHSDPKVGGRTDVAQNTLEGFA